MGVVMQTKVCRTCGEVKPLETSFYRNAKMADGRLSDCSDCFRKMDAQRRAGTKRETQRKDYHPVKDRARRALGRAVADGSIVRQSCEVCGSETTEAHHDDYSKPLDVRWLCKTHHAETHRRYA